MPIHGSCSWCGGVQDTAAAEAPEPDAYEVEDLDKEWISLLSSVDERWLLIPIHPRMCRTLVIPPYSAALYP
jgi:hypothetical protein